MAGETPENPIERGPHGVPGPGFPDPGDPLRIPAGPGKAPLSSDPSLRLAAVSIDVFRGNQRRAAPGAAVPAPEKSAEDPDHPVGIILGSLAGGIVCGMLLHFPLNQSVSIAGGMGWYSLAGVTIGNLAGASLGSIAFLSNLMREIGAFFMIPSSPGTATPTPASPRRRPPARTPPCPC